jgi:hypothetical protein
MHRELLHRASHQLAEADRQLRKPSRHSKRRALAIIALTTLLCSSRNVFASGSACGNLSTASPSDLLAIPQTGMRGPASPGVECTQEGVNRPDWECYQNKTTILQDRMIGRDRRLLLVRSFAFVTPGQPPLDDILIYSCIAGQVKRVLESSPYTTTNTKIESADPNKVILVSDKDPNSNSGGRVIFRWNKIVQRYWPEGQDESDISPPSVRTISCDKLKTAKAKTLIILANGDFTDASGGFPFTHGIGCYNAPSDDPKHCEWQVDLVKDRMISASRRVIVLGSDHQAGVGSFGFVYIFGCVAGQVRTVLGQDFGYSASIEKASADKVTVSTPEQGPKDPRCCPTREGLMTYTWKDALQNYILTSEDYHPYPLDK